MQIVQSTYLALLGAGLLACSGTRPEIASPGAGMTMAVQRAAPARCDGAVQHPIQVRVTALDPTRRGEIIRVQVAVTSRDGLGPGVVSLVSTGGAELASPPSVSFGPLKAGSEATTEFAVRLPSRGHRFLLQFRATSEGWSRGATLNLLPDGPADPGRPVTTELGERIIEYRARRIDR